MYNWNDNTLKRKFERELKFAKERGFTDEEVSTLYINKLSKQTKSARILHMIQLAYTLGKLKGIQSVDEGKTPMLANKILRTEKNI